MYFFQAIVASFSLSCCPSGPKPYTQVGSTEDIRASLTSSGRNLSSSIPLGGRAQGVPIDRPSGMNSLIACNSYSNRAGAWSRASYSGRYSFSYGSVETKRYLESTTWLKYNREDRVTRRRTRETSLPTDFDGRPWQPPVNRETRKIITKFRNR